MLRYKMKDMTMCIVCVILGIMLSTIFKTACGCRNIEGFPPPGHVNKESPASHYARAKALENVYYNH